jgi:hypothetical protein
LGDRFFGVISAHVPGAEAAKFDFTSALAAELLKILSKALMPLIELSGAQLAPPGVSMLPDDNFSSQSEEGSVSSMPSEATSDQKSEVQEVEQIALPTPTLKKNLNSAQNVTLPLDKEKNLNKTGPSKNSIQNVPDELPVILPPPL